MIAQMWTDRWVGTRTVRKDDAIQAYLPDLPREDALDLIDDMAADDACPLRDDYEGAAHWPPSIGLVADAAAVRVYIEGIDPKLVPLDLRE